VLLVIASLVQRRLLLLLGRLAFPLRGMVDSTEGGALKIMRIIALALVASMLAAFGIVMMMASTSKAAVLPSKLALVKSNDLTAVGSGYGHDFRWVACGLGTGPPYASSYVACKPGQVPIYASYKQLELDISSGSLKPGTTILFDQETWSWTPLWEQRHPWFWLKQAGLLAHRHGIKIIETTYASSSAAEIGNAVASAPYADVVSIQTQRLDGNPAAFLAFSQQAVAAVRAVSNVPIMLGLAPDAGGIPVPAWKITQEYNQTYNLAQYYWQNADQWNRGPANGCERTGCGATVDQFFASIGVNN
jgi:hypothetical protein